MLFRSNAYLSTVIRGQKNEVAQAVVLMHEQAEDPNFAVVEEIKTIKKLNTERLLADKAILKVIGDAPTEVSGKQFLENLAFQVKDGQLDADDAVQQLRERIREAETESDNVCEECGSLGQRRGGGWIKTLCDNCEEKRRR